VPMNMKNQVSKNKIYRTVGSSSFLSLRALILVLSLLAVPAFAQTVLQPQYFQVDAVTSKVSFPDGRRHDEFASNCVEAPSGSAFAIAKTKIVKTETKNASHTQCSFSASNYKEFIPNFQEPTRLCVNAYVVSRGGPHYGTAGYLKCFAEYALYDNEVRFKPPSAEQHNLEINTTSFPYQLRTVDYFGENEPSSFIEVGVPLRAINDRIQKELTKSINELDSSVTVEIPAQGFQIRPNDSRELTYTLDLDATTKVLGKDVGFRCDVFVRFLIPISQLKEISLINAGSDIHCRTGNLLLQLADFETKARMVLHKKILELTQKQFDLQQTAIATLAEEDPALASLAAPAWLYGRHCFVATEPSLCFGLVWSDRYAFIKYRDQFSTMRQSSGVTPNPIQLSQKVRFYEQWAHEEGFWPNKDDQAKFASGFFDYGLSTQKVEDGDMVLFSGIMCTFGMHVGCDLVRQSIDSNGQPWRSPRRINELSTSDYATFSGDHLKGLLLYWIETKEYASFKNFLTFIKSQATKSPSNEVPVHKGYSTCKQREPNFTCVIGSDWEYIVELANRAGLQHELPKDIYQILQENMTSKNGKIFESFFAISGYRLHLIAASNLISIQLFGHSPVTDEVSKVLTNRQPKNPFFAFMYEGKTTDVLQLIDNKCPNSKARTERHDWAWQRGDHKDAWKQGMIWDCYLAYKLMQ
jgi:hypothetical protein